MGPRCETGAHGSGVAWRGCSCPSSRAGAATRAASARTSRGAEEERDIQRDNYWRAQITITGRGRVKRPRTAFDCFSEGAEAHGSCGPKLVTFKELAPPTMVAQAPRGWRFDHWEASIREPDGSVHGRPGQMPDGKVYIDGFGYSDTGQLETVTAVFVPDADAHEGVQP